MEETKINSWQWVFTAILGALVSGIGYYPIFFVIYPLISNLGIKAYCTTRECAYMSNQLLCISWFAAVGMGALCGLVGAVVAESLVGSVLEWLGLVSGERRYMLWIGAVIGGLVAAILVATVALFVRFILIS
jgi:hypothetical protein